MDVSPIDDEMYATHDTNNNHNTTHHRRASFTGGRTRMRRRGSVVKTMLEDSPKNVDGDGQYMAAASTATTSSYDDYAAVQVHEAMYGDYGANAGTSSQQQIKQNELAEAEKRAAIRAKAADDLDHVHKIIPKSKDAKQMMYNAIKPKILFQACSPEESVDLVDAMPSNRNMSNKSR